MYLTHLSLTNYRSFTRLDLDVPRRVLVLVGSNAQGKTSLLEAIYYLATFSSFHTHSDRQLVNFLASSESLAVARIVAQFDRSGKSHRMEVRLILENGANGGTRLRREILVDGVKRTANEALGQFNAVIFLPQMTRILEDGPEERRNYLNLTLSQAWPGYGQNLSEYNQVLTQRNALLKQLNERGGDIDQLGYWDEMLTSRGAMLIQARIQAIQEVEKAAARVHHRLSHSREILRLIYQPSYDPLPRPEGQIAIPLATPTQRNGFSLEEIRQGFCRRLQAARNEEVARGLTTIGPHRDEVRFMSNGIDLGDFGSRGQIRTALMALKLAEVTWLKDKTGQWPVLLLDEILAELDVERRTDLLHALGDCEQALLSTTDLNLFPADFTGQCTLWKVNSGQVEA